MLCFCLILSPYSAFASNPTIDVGKLANAIYKAEGGAKTRHPYGVLKKYKTTTPRQACINTINHKYQDWLKTGCKGDFITYLGSKYAPINSDTDNGTNRYWVKNVRNFYANQ